MANLTADGLTREQIEAAIEAGELDEQYAEYLLEQIDREEFARFEWNREAQALREEMQRNIDLLG